MNIEQKHECYDKAIRALPETMTVKDLLIFAHGLCASFDTDPQLMAFGLMATSPSDNEEEKVTMSFKDKKLQQLLGGDVD